MLMSRESSIEFLEICLVLTFEDASYNKSSVEQPTKKHHRMERLVSELVDTTACEVSLPAPYLAYFVCFNHRQYYEAHDVLEHLWLQDSSNRALFFKGLIQLAGAFVHLQKHYYRPHHYKFQNRLRPASRLFRLSSLNCEQAPEDPCLGLRLEDIKNLCLEYASALESGNFKRNPWAPHKAPRLLPEDFAQN